MTGAAAAPAGAPSALGGPVAPAQRIASLDVLRGVAVLGILVMNVQSLSMIGAAYINPTAYGDLTGVNWWVWYFGHLLADMKFITIFSMLFGAGVVLMTERCEATGRGSAGVHYRRMAWLLVIGLAHAYLLWYGDILVTYAVCGLVLWLFRKLPPWLLIVLGLCSIGVAFGFSMLWGTALARGWIPMGEIAPAWDPPAEEVRREVEVYRGGWLDQMADRVPSALFFQTFLFFFVGIGWRTGGVMLIGMALYKLGVLSAARSRGFYAALVGAAALIGIPVVAYGVHRNVEAGWDVTYSFFFGPLFNFWGSLVVAMGWIGAVMLACQSERLRPLTRPFAAAGQMALTNYLLQTVICTTVFYGHGLGLFGRFERWQQLLLVAGIWAFQLIVSPLWMRRFRFGPAEWLWRSLTYLRLQPLRR